MTPRASAKKLAAVVSGSAIIVALMIPAPSFADGITVTRSCQDGDDPACPVQLAPQVAAVAVTGPSTGLGPAIELNLAANQVADAGTPVHLARANTGRGGTSGPQLPGGVANNNFATAVTQTGTSTATSGTSSSDSTGAQAGGSSSTQNPPGAGSDPGASGGQTPPSGTGSDPGASAAQTTPSSGSTSGVNIVTNVATIVQIVQVVARNNSNSSITPVQTAAQCQQTAVSCSVNGSGHP